MANQSNPANWFEIPAIDLDRAKQFYETVLDLQLSLNAMGPMEMAFFPWVQGGTGAAGTLIKSEGYTPSHAGTLVYFSVADIEGILAKVNANGGKTLTPKTGIGEHGFFAHFEDCEGNRVGVHSVR